MNTEVEELARVIDGGAFSPVLASVTYEFYREEARRIASAILAAGYALRSTVRAEVIEECAKHFDLLAVEAHERAARLGHTMDGYPNPGTADATKRAHSLEFSAAELRALAGREK